MAAHAGDGHVERREAEDDLGADVLEGCSRRRPDLQPAGPGVDTGVPSPAVVPGHMSGKAVHGALAVIHLTNQRSRRMSRSEVHAPTVRGAHPPAMRTAGGMPYRHCRTSQTRTLINDIRVVSRPPELSEPASGNGLVALGRHGSSPAGGYRTRVCRMADSLTLIRRDAQPLRRGDRLVPPGKDLAICDSCLTFKLLGCLSCEKWRSCPVDARRSTRREVAGQDFSRRLRFARPMARAGGRAHETRRSRVFPVRSVREKDPCA
jgi:hypothetical protein